MLAQRHWAERAAEVGRGGTPCYPLGDALGSVRGATDEAGALVGSANYAVFGAVQGTSTSGSSLGPTGEQQDTETGLMFLRARQSDPTSGRLTGGAGNGPHLSLTRTRPVRACLSDVPCRL